ncbi:MAG TPA: LysM domain-containing protein [Gaiellaceae bacterium]|nr:LysM domain-containing protein [Gaiellaceae bacterium]
MSVSAPQRGTSAAHVARFYAAPAAVLLAVTVAVLLVRGLLPRPAAAPARTHTTAAVAAAAETHHAKRRTPARRYVIVERGDTLAEIAAGEHMTVEALEALNPGVEPTALRVGQRIRVK